jgi:hypothetical protein
LNITHTHTTVSVPVLQILEDTGKILVLPVLCTNIVVPVSRTAVSYYPPLFVKFIQLYSNNNEKKKKKKRRNIYVAYFDIYTDERRHPHISFFNLIQM